MQASSAYFQIHPRDFKFEHYDHGTHALKQKYGIKKELFRYFNKRNFLFSRFEEGIAIDEESWYSVIPEVVSLYLLKRFKEVGVKKIFEPFSGVGGIAIHLCEHFEEYVVNDLDPNKLKMLEHNMKVYNKNMNRLITSNLDFLEVEPFQTDAMIICPPWGGIHCDDYSTIDADELMKPKLTDILSHAMKFSSQIMLQMPKQTNIGLLMRSFQRVGLAPYFTVEKIMTNSKCSQLFFYLGSEEFMQLDKSPFYNKLYKDLGSEGKEEKKKVRLAVKASPTAVMGRVYKVLHPNKKIML